jgi:hypothetical protein
VGSPTRNAVSLFAVRLLAVSLVAGAPAPMAAQSATPPRVAVEPESRDLGVVGLGEEAVAEFLVRNTGGGLLTLTLLQPTQGVEVEGIAAELSAGESVRLRVRIDTLSARFGDRQEPTLVTNDPDRARVALVVRLDVQPFLRVRPGHARYLTYQHAREGTLAQTVGAVDGAPFRILRVDSPVPSLRVTFREARSEEREPAWTGSQWRVDLTLASNTPVGALTGYVIAHTDHPRQRRAFIPVSGFVRPMLAVTPPEARLGDLDRRRTTPVPLLVKSFAEGAIQITGVSTDVLAVRAEIEPVEPGRTWRVRLLPVPDAPLGLFQGTLRLRTAIPELPSVEVPLSGRLVEASPPATP